MEKFKIYLYKSRWEKKGWFAYVMRRSLYTLAVELEAGTYQSAKVKAVSRIRRYDFTRMKLLDYNLDHPLWGLDNWPRVRDKILEKAK